MAEEFKVEIIKRETIKPSSLTPSHLKTYKLSLLDQLTPALYVNIVFFYPKNEITSEQRSHQLKKLLSESLTLPFSQQNRIKASDQDFLSQLQCFMSYNFYI